MVFESRRSLKYIKFHPLSVIFLSAVFGPLYFVYVGAIECAVMVALMFLLLDASYLLPAHFAIALLSPLMIRLCLIVRGYDKTTLDEVHGRYRRASTLW